MLIVMTGLPGTGKSTLAVRLAEELRSVVLSKDVVRAALFPPPVLDYSPEQDELTMTALYAATAHLLQRDPSRAVILDGRTFSKRSSLEGLLGLCATIRQPPLLIQCVCDDSVAKERLEHDQQQGNHPASNRTFDLYLRIKATAEPNTLPSLVLDTGKLDLSECLALSLAWIHNRGGRS